MTERETTDLGIELLPALEEAWTTLEKSTDDPVEVQKVLELMVMRHCVKMGDRDTALHVAHHLNRHAQQLINQAFDLFPDGVIPPANPRQQPLS